MKTENEAAAPKLKPEPTFPALPFYVQLKPAFKSAFRRRHWDPQHNAPPKGFFIFEPGEIQEVDNELMAKSIAGDLGAALMVLEPTKRVLERAGKKVEPEPADLSALAPVAAAVPAPPAAAEFAGPGDEGDPEAGDELEGDDLEEDAAGDADEKGAKGKHKRGRKS